MDAQHVADAVRTDLLAGRTALYIDTISAIFRPDQMGQSYQAGRHSCGVRSHARINFRMLMQLLWFAGKYPHPGGRIMFC
jgi:hypothetical protein